MHLFFSYALPDLWRNPEYQEQALAELADLTYLPRFLYQLDAQPWRQFKEWDPIAPHEYELATAWGWSQSAKWPWAAQQAHTDGIHLGNHTAWALVTPVHLKLGQDHTLLTDPQQLQLSEENSRDLFRGLQETFESEGFSFHYGAPLRWYVSHPCLSQITCPSLERVVGRRVEPWVPREPEIRLIRRLQSEAQMILHPHRVNEMRATQGLWPINSVWFSGCGHWQSLPVDAVKPNEWLKESALSQNFEGWIQAWKQIDTQVLAPVLQQRGKTNFLSLTLCGEQSSRIFSGTVKNNIWARVFALCKPIQIKTLLKTPMPI
jgi:hypothetical protein